MQRNTFLLFVCHKSWCNVVSLGRCSLFPSRVGLRTYQHPVFVQRITRSDTRFSFNINICKAYYIQPGKEEEEGEVHGAYTFRNKRDLK